jgi:hypothetical protein
MRTSHLTTKILTVLLGITNLKEKVKILSLKLKTFQIFMYLLHKDLRGY